METTIIVLSVVYAITLILFGFLVRYYRNEIQRKIQYRNEYMNHYLELCIRNSIIENQNFKYSTICRNLYNNNQDLRLELEKVAKTKKKTKAVK